MRTSWLMLGVACAGDPTVVAPVTLPPPECPTFAPGSSVGTVPTPPAREVSGIAVAPDGRLFVHNDSGEPAEVHVLSGEGSFLGTWMLEGVDAIDFEDLAIGPGPDGNPWVWVGDIGDNNAERPFVTVYRFPLPEGDSGTVVAEELALTYPDGARDAETLFVDPSGALWLVSKAVDGNTGVYRVLRPLPGPGILERVMSLQFGEPPLGQTTLVTGGDAGPEGLVLRTYLTAGFIWPINPGEELLPALQRPPCPVTLVGEGQAEAIAWTPDGGLVTVSEGETPSVNLHLQAP